MPAHNTEHKRPPLRHGFSDRWLAESVRLQLPRAGKTPESFSGQQISSAESLARAYDGGPEARVLRWASLLAVHTDLVQAMHSWRQRAGVVLALMLVLAFAGGLSAALGVMGRGNEPVNVLWALGALLGVNLLMLLVWLLSLGAAPGALSAGRLWLWLSARFYGREALTLAQSFSGLSQRVGATRWWMAGITHSVWSSALAGALAGLLIALSLRSYAFVWETTILPAALFTSLVQSLAWLPSLIGFPMPEENTIRLAGLIGSDAVLQTDEQRRAWAGWLCGAVLVYGLLPRLILLGLSAWRLSRSLARVRLDLHSADWSALSQRLSPASQSLGVTDPAPDLPVTSRQKRGSGIAGHAESVVVGFELDDQISWPPVFGESAIKARYEQVISRQQRTLVLQQLDQSPPRALLLVCDSAQTVDRGSLAWLGEASGRVLHVAVWLAGKGTENRRAVWRQQLQTLGLLENAVFDTESDARQWLEAHS
ncbi:MAG: DUF2868 domain-containing protein [Pseudohongiella sp.]|nr:DUF2868 domain-containing protein [Pseudohongiella sp.]